VSKAVGGSPHWQGEIATWLRGRSFFSIVAILTSDVRYFCDRLILIGKSIRRRLYGQTPYFETVSSFRESGRGQSALAPPQDSSPSAFLHNIYRRFDRYSAGAASRFLVSMGYGQKRLAPPFHELIRFT